MRIEYFRPIVKVGNSKSVAIPKEIRILIGADVGDWVRIEIEKVDINDTNLHVDNAARQDTETRDKGIHQDARHPQMDLCKGNRARRL